MKKLIVALLTAFGFCGNAQTNYPFNEGYGINFIAPTSTNPPVISFLPETGTNKGGKDFDQPCNVFYPASTSTVSYPFILSNAFADLMQVFGQTNSSSVLSMGVMNDDGIIAIESLPGALNSGALKLNPGCMNNVEICQGGGQTTVFGDEHVNGAVTIGTGPFIYPLTQLAVNLNTGVGKSITVQDPAVTGSNKTIFEVSNTGKTTMGLQPGSNNQAMLSVNVKSSSSGPLNALDIYDEYNGGAVNFRVKSNGFTYARELNVQLTGFPDYVFEKNFKLPSLQTLERYIQKYKHLPDVPTAKEIETNGANLGELCKIQMQKIEELTLYLIQMKKELDLLKDFNDGIK